MVLQKMLWNFKLVSKQYWANNGYCTVLNTSDFAS